MTLSSHLEPIDNFILNNQWAWFLIVTFLLYTQCILFYLAVVQEWKIKWYWFVILLPIIAGVAAVRVFVPMDSLQVIQIISLTTDIFIFVVLPVLFGKLVIEQKFEGLLVRALLGWMIYIGYVEISFAIKEIGDGFAVVSSPIVSIILLIDVYIAMSVVYVYSNSRRKEV